MRTPIVTALVFSILSVSIAAGLWAIGTHHAVAAALAQVNSFTGPLTASLLASVAEMATAFNTAYQAALADLSWQPAAYADAMSSPAGYGTAAGYTMALGSVLFVVLAIAALTVTAVGFAIGFAVGGLSGGLGYLKGRFALL